MFVLSYLWVSSQGLECCLLSSTAWFWEHFCFIYFYDFKAL